MQPASRFRRCGNRLFLGFSLASIFLASLLALFLPTSSAAGKQINALSNGGAPSLEIQQNISSAPLLWGETTVFSLTVTNTTLHDLPAIITSSLSGPITTSNSSIWTPAISSGDIWHTEWQGYPMTGVTGLIHSQVQVTVPASWAENLCYPTTCAEEDNVNIPLIGDNVHQFRITATHPLYNIEADNCAANFSGCSQRAPLAPTTVSCDTLYDDGTNVFSVCSDTEWWLPNQMTVTIGGDSATGHRLVWNSKIAGENSWPEVLVLYQDGNMRLKPQPPIGVNDVCFGSSVIVGPATPDSLRPFVEIEQITINPSKLSLAVLYKDGTTSQLDLTVNREKAEVTVLANYDTSESFATFRSMYVTEENADVARVTTAVGDYALLDILPTAWSPAWSSLAGPYWFFYRQQSSSHNTSAPDIRIEALDGFTTFVSTLTACVEQCTTYLPISMNGN